MNLLNIVVWLQCVHSMLLHSFDRLKSERENRRKIEFEENRTPKHRAHNPQWLTKDNQCRGKINYSDACMVNAYEFDTQTFGSHLNNNFHWKRFVLFTFTVNQKYIIHFAFNDVCLCMYSSENILFLVRFQSNGNRLINRWKGLQRRACKTKHHMTICVCVCCL